MGTSKAQDEDFAKALGTSEMLERAVEWIGKNLNPEDVFSYRDLQHWAVCNGVLEDKE